MSDEQTELKKEKEEKKEKKFEIICGIFLALFACVLAISDMGGGNCDNDSLKMYNEKSNAFQWYSAKSIKQNLVEGQRDILKSLLTAGVIKNDQQPVIQKMVNDYDNNIKRYNKEKNEILMGSSVVGKDNWAQDVNGVLGKIIGAQEYDSKALKLSEGGDIFDQSTLFLQICLVIGALSLLIQGQKLKWIFLVFSILLGVIGVFFCIKGYIFVSMI